MAFLEWRKFNFFDLKRDIDNHTLTSKLNDILISATTSGDNQIYLGDSLGQIHTVIRNWHLTTFSAYSLRVLLAFTVKPFLVTIGEDEEGVNPVIKVWDTNRLDKNDAPFCTRITKAIPNNTAVQANTLCVHENAQLMAVGFVDGSLILYRGDITRDRSSKPKLLRNASSAITGLAFKNSTKSVMLFVSTENAVYVYNITHKDKETMLQLDTSGCEKNCSILAYTLQGSHFMVARNDAVYCYTADGRGPCYAIEGTKVKLEWFRTYLIIISRSNRITSTSQQSASAVISSSPTTNNTTVTPSTAPALTYTVTVLDIKNKFIVFTAPINAIRSLINELGGFYLLDCDNHLHQLDEKDLQSKLQVLFKKNLYDVAIRIAESQKHDPEALVEIFRQYGDHLYSKGDHGGAIEQYIRTIGRLEPSYVIRKFLDSQHIERLTSYLQAVHKKGRATADHTTLLLNCFTKLNKTENLKEFILQKDKDLVFNVDIAIKVCRHASPEEALMLAKRHERHDLYINFLLEDHKKYVDAINYISTLKFEEAEQYMRKYGNILVENAPNESTQFLKRLCTNFNNPDEVNISGNSDNIDGSLSSKENILNGVTNGINGIELQKADPYDFMSFFVGNSEKLVEFLEYLIAEQCQVSSHVYDMLLEHYLYVWESQKAPPDKAASTQHLLQLLQNPDARYDRTQALLLCHQRSFSAGVLYLYERDKLYGQILGYHEERADYDAVVACCRRFGHMEPGLWLQALKCVVRSGGGGQEEYKRALRKSSLQELGSDAAVPNKDEEISAPPVELLNEILNVIAKERLLSPQQVIDTIHTSARSDITLGHTDTYLVNELKREQQLTIANEELTTKYRVDTDKLREEIEGMRTGNTIIQVSRCAACHYQLELPSLHFLCQHSYHQYCFQSLSDTDQSLECPVCRPDNQQLLELLKARGCSRDTHETFHDQLDKSSDGVTLAAEYFGRGVFDIVTVVTDVKDNKKIQEVSRTSVQVEQKRKVTIDGKKDNEGGSSAIIKPIIRTDPSMSINYSNYGPGAEAKMRREEKLKPTNPMVIKHISEGRIRAQEHGFGSSFETGRNLEPARTVINVVKQVEAPKVELPPKKAFEPPNPFDEAGPANPFDGEDMDEEPDDYDKDGKNPFFEGENE